MGFLDYKGLERFLKNSREEFAQKNHTHDERYYTEYEIDNKLSKKSGVDHIHDDRYYTEAEVDGKLEKKSSTDHTHDLSELISNLSIGTSTTLNDAVQIITQDTDTANQKYYRRPLAVLWDYIKSKADSVYSAIGHNHKIQNLEDYTTRVWDATIVRQADTVLASPQDKDGIATFRKLDKNDVGLENVDNTADKNKNVATAGIATMGVRDYNNANNTIKIGWQGADLDAKTLAYVAGYTSDKKIHPASKDGVRSWLGLGDSAYKNTKSRSNKGSTDWTNNATDDAIVPTMSFMAYWDGAYNSNGASNLSYCDRGRFGTIVTKNTGDYAVAGHTHNSIKDVGDGRTTTFAYSKDGMSYADYTWLAGWNGSELRAVHKSQFAIAGHSHSFINSVGVKNAQTGRNQTYGDVYSYNSNASAHTGMPTTYTSTIGFGQGAAGTVEICGEWTGGKGLWSRALRDWQDNWYDWQRIYTDNYHPSADVANKANSSDYLNFTAGNEINFTGTPTNNTVYFGYRNSTINDYRFCNGRGGLTKISAASFDGKATSAGTADSATTAAKLGRNGNTGVPMTFNWNGQGGQPTWLWGSNDGSNIYVWNPSNFSVNYANSAGNGVTASGSNYVRFGDGTQICWGQQGIANAGTTITYAIAFSSIPAVVNSGTEDIDDVFFVRNITTTNFVADKRGWYSGNNTWIAIGRWK